jgi:hypothetical protein
MNVGTYFLVKSDLPVPKNWEKNIFISKDELYNWYLMKDRLYIMLYTSTFIFEFTEINNLIIINYAKYIAIYKKHKYKGERLSLNKDENTLVDRILLKHMINNIK